MQQKETNCSCGLASAAACRTCFEEILSKEFSDATYMIVHRLTVDCYSLQHPQDYMKSAKSYAAHLTGISIFMESDGDPRLRKATQHWLNGKRQLDRPSLPPHFGNLTIAHVRAAADGPAHAERVHTWARDIWQAYGQYHGQAREWIRLAAGTA